MRVRISGNGRARDVELPLPDAQLAWQMEQLWDGSGDLNCTLESAYGDRNPLRRLTGQKVNMDEINFFAKRLDSFTAYERSVLETCAYEKEMGTIKDLINLTYSMKGLSLLTDFSNAVQVARRLYMDEFSAISEEEGRQINFMDYGQKVLAEGKCKILPYGVFVENGFEMQEVYNGRTFPEYWYDTDKTVAVLEMKNKAGDKEYLYLPTDIHSVNMMKKRLQASDLRECSVEGVHNLRLPESLVPTPEKLGSVEDLTYFNEMCQKVCRFDAEQMERLAMAVAFTGAEKYTDITYVAGCLKEFEIHLSIHSDEEYGRFLVTESGLFDVDELLLPHIDYAGLGADARDGTLVASGYVLGGFVGAVRKSHEYLEYKGEFADPLEIDEGCYGEFCLYSPLTGGLSVDGEDAGNLCAGDLTAYGEQIMDAIKKDEGPEGQVRGLMHYFDRDRTVAAKVAAAWPSVREVEGELYGVLECRITGPLTDDEISILKDYWTGQMSDGWGESFEQQPIHTGDGDLYVSFWNHSDSWKVMTAEELGIRQEETMAMSL
ncbi:MAG: hypothetical protein K2O91_12685 [Lachnospiraceae bacterium]|nr:hypothetical protein [Lachnospiraceae bacterium]